MASLPEQIKGEAVKSYSAFCEYIRLGDSRSLEKLRQSRGEDSVSLRQLEALSSKHRWQERLRAYIAAEQDEITIIWQKRQQYIRERDYEQADELRLLADKMLESGPKFIKASRKVETLPDETLPDGTIRRVIREVRTLSIDTTAMIRAIETASKLQRQAAEMDKIRVELSGKDGSAIEIMPIDYRHAISSLAPLPEGDTDDE